MKEEEYQYPKDEFIVADKNTHSTTGTDTFHDEHDPDSSSLFEKKPNSVVGFMGRHKKMVSIISIVLLVLVTFHFMRGEQQKPKVVYEAPKVTPVVSQPNPELVNQLQQLQQGEQSNNNSIQQLQSQMNNLNQTISQTNQSNAELNKALIALAIELKQLKDQLAAHQTVTVVKSGLPHPTLVFHLRAVIPGRAWIVSNENLTQSIRVGDHVPNYGTVTEILDGQGLVKTSSGKFIRYGGDDS